MSFAPAMESAVDALINHWRSLGDHGIVDIATDMPRLTIDVLERTIFSDGLGRNPEDVRNAMSVYFETIGRIGPFDVLGVPDFVPRFTRWQARSSLRFFSKAIDDIVAARRRQISENVSAGPRDILTLLLEAQDSETGKGMTEQEVRGNILTFISAGQETTANALTWSLYLLSQSCEWQERIAVEAERELGGPVEGLSDRLLETRAVIDEAMRVYPPIVALSRAAIGPDELAGEPIKRGSMIVIAPYVLHRHRRLWHQPDIFDPNRFLGENRARIDRFAYLPFGAGPRTCIGAAFALQEATLALAAITKNFELELAPGQTVWPEQKVTLRPRGALKLVLRTRPQARRDTHAPGLTARHAAFEQMAVGQR